MEATDVDGMKKNAITICNQQEINLLKIISPFFSAAFYSHSSFFFSGDPNHQRT
jgi:hypothetical protein